VNYISVVFEASSTSFKQIFLVNRRKRTSIVWQKK